MRSALLPALAIVGLLVHGACANGSGGADVSTGGGPCGTYRWTAGTEECAACMDASCCSEEQHCGAGTACGRLLTCFGGCDATDDGCRGNCEAINSVGQAELAALLACQKSKCGTIASCGAGVCDSRISVAESACATCLGSSCCEAYEECGKDSTCVNCLLTWTNDCENVGTFQAAIVCMDQRCASTCAPAICDSGLGYIDEPRCNTCMTERCCAEVKACADDAACHACALGGGTDCTNDPLLSAWMACRIDACSYHCE